MLFTHKLALLLVVISGWSKTLSIRKSSCLDRDCLAC